MIEPAQVLTSIFIGVGAVIFRGDEVLVIKRGKPPFEGRWSIPGGGLHVGENLKEAVRREVREETGLEIKGIALIDVFEALPGEMDGGVDRHILMVDYVAEWAAGEPVAGDDAAEAEFVSFDVAMARVSWDKTREAMRGAMDLRRAASNQL